MSNGSSSGTNLVIPLSALTLSIVIFVFSGLILMFSACTIPGQMKTFFYRHPLNAPSQARSVDQVTGKLQAGAGSSIGAVSAQQIPSALKGVFDEAGNKVGVPSALLAAFSYRECDSLWSVPNETLKDWIDNNKDVDADHCGKNNGFDVFGPAQFYWYTWGYTSPSEAPHGIPEKRGYGAKAADYTGHRPASIYNIKDSFYAMAIMVKANSGNTGGEWTEEQIRKTAEAYCRSCTDQNCGGKNNNYCGGIWNLYQQFSR